MSEPPTSPNQYIERLEPGQRQKVELLRSLILEAVPDAVESIRYRMLHYDHGGELFALAAQKHHVSLYVMATGALQVHADDLRDIDHGKGCLRFRAKDAIPVDTIAAVLRTARDSDERACHTGEG